MDGTRTGETTTGATVTGVATGTDGGPGPTAWAHLMARAAEHPDAVAVLQKRFGLWTSTTAADLVGRAGRTAMALQEAGIGEGDVVALVLGPFESRVVTDLALQLTGATVLGIATNTPLDTVRHVLGDAAPRIAVVQGQHAADGLLELIEHDALPSIERMYYLDPAGVEGYANPILAPFPDVDAEGPVPASLPALVAALDPDHAVVRGYTSGTTGLPTPVLRTHADVLAAARAAIEAFGLGPEDRVMSVRALSDPVERGATVMAALVSGAVLVLPESRTSVGQAMVEIAPTYVHLTQRHLEDIATEVRLKMQGTRGLKRLVLRSWNRRVAADAAAGRLPTPSPISRMLVGRPVLAKLGLDQVRWLLVSGTTGSTEAVAFFASLGLDVRPAYSSAHAGGFCLVATSRAMAAHGAMAPLPGMKARVVDGELQFAGDAVAGGVARGAPVWEETGDRAEEVAEGIVVTGRLGDDLVLPDGRTVPAQLVAGRLRSSPYIRDAVVHQEDGRTIAVLEATSLTIGRWATAQGLRFTTARSLLGLPEVADLLRRAVDAVGDRLDVSVDEVRILTVPLAVADGTLTTSEKAIPHAVLAADVVEPAAPRGAGDAGGRTS